MDTATSDAGAERRPRVEDDTLVRGAGRFVADRPEPGQAYAQFARSPHACAQIRAIDTEAAKAAPGVVAVLTGADMDAAGVGNVGRHPPIAGRGGTKLVMPRRPALARERVMHVGVPVAMVATASMNRSMSAGPVDRPALARTAPGMWLRSPRLTASR